MATETAVIEKAAQREQREKEHKEVFSKLSAEELSKQQDEFLDAFYPTKKPEATKQEPAIQEQKADENEKKSDPEKKKEPDQKQEPSAETKTAEEVAKDKETKKEEPAKEKPKRKRALLQEMPVDQSEPEPEPEMEPVTEEEPPKKSDKSPEPEIEDLDEVDREQLAGADWLAQNDTRFQGRDLAKELRTFWKREDAYANKWEKNNPGQEFDPESVDHADFYRQNKPITERDLAKALKGVERDQIKAEVKREVQEEIAPELQQTRIRERYREVSPKIERASASALGELAVRGVSEFSELIPDSEKGRTITEDIYGKLVEQNPVAVEILDEEAAVLQIQIQELETLRHLGDVIQPNRDKRVPVNGRIIMPVADIAQAGVELERRIQSQPEADREFEGKKFVPRAVLNERVNSIIREQGSDQQKRAKINALYKKYWTIGADEIREYLINKSAGRVKRLVERIPKPEQKNGHKSGSLPSTEAARTTEKTVEKSPPSTASSSDQVDTGLGKGGKATGIAEEVDRAMGW